MSVEIPYMFGARVVPDRATNPAEGPKVPEGMELFDDLPDRCVHDRFMAAVDRNDNELLEDIGFRQQLFAMYRAGRIESDVLDKCAVESVNHLDARLDWIEIYGDDHD